MVLFSLVIQQLRCKNSDACDLKLNTIYADDGKPGGRIPAVHHAHDTFRADFPLAQYYLQPMEIVDFGRRRKPCKLANLVRAYPTVMRYEDSGCCYVGFCYSRRLLAARLLDESFQSIDRALSLMKTMSIIGNVCLSLSCASLLRVSLSASSLPALPPAASFLDRRALMLPRRVSMRS
jgi:hypothetical protein